MDNAILQLGVGGIILMMGFKMMLDYMKSKKNGKEEKHSQGSGIRKALNEQRHEESINVMKNGINKMNELQELQLDLMRDMNREDAKQTVVMQSIESTLQGQTRILNKMETTRNGNQ